MAKGRKLLLADDSVTIQKVVDLTFGDEGFEVITASDGEQAILKVAELAPDIVLADVFMPGLNGYQVCERIKRDERTRHIPVMLLVGSFEPFDEQEARRVGADDHLTKPFQSIRELISKVGALLGGSSGESKSQPAEENLDTTRELTLSEMREEALQAQIEAHKPHEPLSTSELEVTTADTIRFPYITKERAEESQPEEPAIVEAPTPAQAEERQPEPVAAQSSESVSDKRKRMMEQLAALQSSDDDTGLALYIPQEDKPAPPAPQPEAKEVVAAAAGVGQHAPQVFRSSNRVDDALLDLGNINSSSLAARNSILDVDELMSAPASVPMRVKEAAAPVEEASAALVEEESESVAPVEELDLEDTLPHVSTSEEEFTQPSPQAVFEETQAYVSQPPAEVVQTEEQGTAVSSAQESHPASSEPVIESHEPSQVSSQSTGRITLDQLSPEVIDAIARRAVEQLSTQVVEQVAWEVVPHLAELLIKRRLEEKQ
ncbi:MAG: response regulator [Pyrinomonadaceae bacterium]